LLLLAIVSFAGCTGEPARRSRFPQAAAPTDAALVLTSPRLTPIDAAACRTLIRDDATAESLRHAATRNLEYLLRLPVDKRVRMVDRDVSVLDLLAVSQAVAESSGDDWSWLCDRFRAYRVELGETLQVTGFYQPELSASRKRTERFRYPVYRTPDDLVEVDLRETCPDCPGRTVLGRMRNGQLEKYYTRAEIEAGVLAGRGQELAWLDDPVEAYFLHVQGSALLRLEDGVQLQISYSGSNGYPYTSIGRVLIEQGKLSREALSLQSLKSYLRAHPEEQAAIFAANQRYVFFRGVVTGPIGSCNIPLTAGRSVAVDPEVYAHGALGFLHIRPRSDALTVQRPYSRLVLMQDAGSAVSGASRLDVYWGSGEIAEQVAGDMRNPGELHVFLLN
jgi:membrane-bound lytic murein transglycosylase A